MPKTAIAADSNGQLRALVPVTHYFDLKRRCRDCHHNFIFFVKEQRHWYETFHFYIGADCVRCIDYRTADRTTKQLRWRYETLLKQTARFDQEAVELAEIVRNHHAIS